MKILIFLIAVGFAVLANANVSQEEFNYLVKQVFLLEAKVEGLEDQNNNLQAENNDLVERVTRLEVRFRQFKLPRSQIANKYLA